MIVLISLAVLLLAGYGAWALVVGVFNPWHWLAIGGLFGLLLLAIRLGWVEIGNLDKRPPK